MAIPSHAVRFLVAILLVAGLADAPALLVAAAITR